MQLGAAKSSDRADLSTVRNACHPIDLVHLSRYTLGDRALEREALALFAAQSGIYLDRLHAAADDKQWHDAAHSLKGSAKAIGAFRVAAAAELSEALKGEQLARERATWIERLDGFIAEARTYIDGLLQER
jgi:HPt (histidine-containing phosphotransfer) domain-containing protein